MNWHVLFTLHVFFFAASYCQDIDVTRCGLNIYNATYWESKYNFQMSLVELKIATLYESGLSTTELPDTFPSGAERKVASYATALIENGDKMIFFYLRQEVIFTWYGGSTVSVIKINNQTGELTTDNIGIASHIFVTSHRPGDIGGLRLAHPKAGRYAVVGITDIPAFTVPDETIPTKKELIQRFPQHADLFSISDNS